VGNTQTVSWGVYIADQPQAEELGFAKQVCGRPQCRRHGSHSNLQTDSRLARLVWRVMHQQVEGADSVPAPGACVMPMCVTT
jgi:hypothetical protein